MAQTEADEEIETLVKHPYHDSDAAAKPLFGEARTRDRVLNLIVGVFTGLLVSVTLVSSFAFETKPQGINIYFSICIALTLFPHILLIVWYRQGDLEPRFRSLIYYNAFTIILLCICANLYIHNAE